MQKMLRLKMLLYSIFKDSHFLICLFSFCYGLCLYYYDHLINQMYIFGYVHVNQALTSRLENKPLWSREIYLHKISIGQFVKAFVVKDTLAITENV